MPKHVEVVRPHLVEALLLAWKDTKVAEPTAKIREFNKLHHDRLRFMYDVADVNGIMDSLDQPLGVKEAVYRAVARYELGKKLFDDTLQQVLSKQCSELIWTEVKTQLKNHKMTPELSRKFITDVHGKCLALDPQKLMKAKRKVRVCYREQQVDCKVDTILAEIELVVGTLIKEVAVTQENDGIPFLHFEPELISTIEQPTLASVAGEMLPKYKYGRVLMNCTLAAFESGGNETVVSVVNSKKEACIKHDPTFQMDANWLKGMCGTTGETICEGELLHCFPDGLGQPMTYDTCLQKLQVLQKSALVNFVPPALGNVTSALEIVNQLKLSTPPDFAKSKITTFMSCIVDRCQYFLRLAIKDRSEKPTGKKEEGEVVATKFVTGLEALKHEYGILQDALEKDEGSLVTPDMLRNFRVFWWLCEPSWKPTLSNAEAVLRRKHGLDEAPGSSKVPVQVGGASSSAAGPRAKVPRKGDKDAGKLARAATLRDKVLSAF